MAVGEKVQQVLKGTYSPPKGIDHDAIKLLSHLKMHHSIKQTPRFPQSCPPKSIQGWRKARVIIFFSARTISTSSTKSWGEVLHNNQNVVTRFLKNNIAVKEEDTTGLYAKY